MSNNPSNKKSSRDHLSKNERSRNMSKIRQKDTRPEILLRKFLFRNGFRYRINVKKLPGTPDLVLRKYKTVIFVHGCYWHRHDCRKGRSMPSVRKEFWGKKFQDNINRDKKARNLLSKEGWKVIIVWECELSNVTNRKERLTKLIDEINSDESR